MHKFRLWIGTIITDRIWDKTVRNLSEYKQKRKLPAPSAADTLRVHAVSRLMLDNVPHVKAFWIATGVL